jgi:Xaa-Pro aminopeptidase
MRYLLFFIASFLIPVTSFAQSDYPILSERAQAEWIEEITLKRFEQVLPALMDRCGIDMWVLISREYNEDPVVKTMLPPDWYAARRRTIFVFNMKDDGTVERVAIARYKVGSFFDSAWDPDVTPDQYEALKDYIIEKKPKKIGINVSFDFGHADGLAHSDFGILVSTLPNKYKEKLESAECLAVGWLESRIPEELELYPSLCNMGHRIVDEAFSPKVIKPGVTTTKDVVWWLRQRAIDLGLSIWFQPTVSIQRADGDKNTHLSNFASKPAEDVIQYGDLLHVDFGITYLRLNTDQQQHYYVLPKGEKEAPKSIVEALKTANRAQDVLTSKFEPGKTGNVVLKESLQQCAEEGIQATIYTHPIGYHGHGAGPTIGLWDQQGGVPGKGDYPLYANTVHSIELNIEAYIPEWDKSIRIMLEEEAIFDGETVVYPDGRQTEMYTIKYN